MSAKKIFYSYTEAQEAVKLLAVKSIPDYKKRYCVDSKLPSKPEIIYADSGWSDWYSFLGKEKPVYYATYAELKAAAQSLGIKSQPQYKKLYSKDPKLPSNPETMYADAGWLDWYDFLGKKKPVYYPTYAEFKAAVQSLRIKSQPEYKKLYRKDPKLPSNPETMYANAGWEDWYRVFDRIRPSFYTTYAEAQAAAQFLKIKKQPEYAKRYRADPKLPSNPEATYKKAGWVDWYDFLGNVRPSFYKTYAEARFAVQELGIIRQTEYRTFYRKDMRLPASPPEFYADIGWIDWYDFLGNDRREFYPTYVEAKGAARALGIKNQLGYKKRYTDDSRLPACPHLIYADAGWTNWYDFLGTESPKAASTDYKTLWSDLNRWLKTQTGITLKRAAIRIFIGVFWRAQALPDDGRYLLLRTNPFNAVAYQQFIEAQAESLRKPYHRAISAFFNWLLDEYCTDTDADERIVLPEYRNPFETVLAGYADSLQAYRHSESTKPPLGYEYILRARNYLVPNGHQVLQTSPKLSDLPHLQEFFDGRSDWIYVEESIIDYSDPNCIWRKVLKADRFIDGARVLVDSYQIWSPLRFVALYSLLR